MSGTNIESWLGLSVVGTVISTFGALLGIFIKDYFFQRSFEEWKQQQTLEQVYQKFRDPLVLSARELASRINEILEHYPTVYLRTEVLTSNPEKQLKNSINDPYFQRYKLVSTTYRFAAFLAWLELYRQELTFFRTGSNKKTKELEQLVELIRSDLADGQLNRAPDWEEWKDVLVFREELRAIGESLIESRGLTRTVMGYGCYCENLNAQVSNAVQRWMPVILNFLLDLEETGKDFRKVRLKRTFVHLVSLMKLLDGALVETYLENKYQVLSDEIKA